MCLLAPAFRHLRALRDIASESGGNRAAGTLGYDRSAEYVAESDVQKTTNETVDATVRSFEDATKATQATAAEVADCTRRSFEHGALTMEKLLRAKSPDKAFEVQTEYAKAAYESYVSHATKLGQLQ